MAISSRSPFEDAQFDHVMMFNVLTCTPKPKRAIGEAVRVLRPNGTFVAVTLRAHDQNAVTETYGHVRAGFEPPTLRRWLNDAGLTVQRCEVTSRERRKPYFEVISAFARRDRVREASQGTNA